MKNWQRLARGILGMGATFGAVSAAVFGTIAVVLGVFFPGVENDLGFVVLAGSSWGFATGIAFSGALAIAGRTTRFEELTVARVALLGAAGGLGLAALLVGTTWWEWTVADALVPLTILPALGAASGSTSLLLARRAGRELDRPEEPDLVSTATAMRVAPSAGQEGSEEEGRGNESPPLEAGPG